MVIPSLSNCIVGSWHLWASMLVLQSDARQSESSKLKTPRALESFTAAYEEAREDFDSTYFYSYCSWNFVFSSTDQSPPPRQFLNNVAVLSSRNVFLAIKDFCQDEVIAECPFQDGRMVSETVSIIGSETNKIPAKRIGRSQALYQENCDDFSPLMQNVVATSVQQPRSLAKGFTSVLRLKVPLRFSSMVRVDRVTWRLMKHWHFSYSPNLKV
ncbi:hypothetical protein BDZ45DRAFT_734962 [Acephala macrosclerotiorum]|nr:hypothetical protein BDZ45DRAFT_734962 [Acephala macrosclerotiorum]